MAKWPIPKDMKTRSISKVEKRGLAIKNTMKSKQARVEPPAINERTRFIETKKGREIHARVKQFR